MSKRSFNVSANGLTRIACIALIATLWGLSQRGWVPSASNVADVQAVASANGRSATQAIETIRVGDRVLARNPEVSDAQRAALTEPNWAEWLHVSLQLPLRPDDQTGLASGQVMKIELLRPEAWLLKRISYAAQARPSNEVASECLTDELHGNQAVLTIPHRHIFLESSQIAEWLAAEGLQLLSQSVELDLLEMGAVGSAAITDIQPCRPIEPGAGQVVTATFEHPPATQVLDISFSADSAQASLVQEASVVDSQAIGVTDNHPFWSIDAQRFVPIGQLAVGSRVVTYLGETKRIASKVLRSGVQSVYNLEVYGEQVYFVGNEGLLAHNNCEIGDLGERTAKDWLDNYGYTEIMQFKNRSGHGLDVAARHRDGTLTFFEVKASAGPRAPGLSEAQSDQATFISTRLGRAATPGPWWRATTPAVRGQAEKLLEDIELGRKYRRYVIEITNATNSSQSQFRILPW